MPHHNFQRRCRGILAASLVFMGTAWAATTTYFHDTATALADGSRLVWNSDGRIYGLLNSPVRLFSVRPDGSERIETATTIPDFVRYSQGTKNIVANGSGKLYGGAFPGVTGDRVTGDCPKAKATSKPGGGATYEFFHGYIYKASVALPVTPVAVSKSKPVCPKGNIATSAAGDLYFVSSISDNRDPSYGMGLYRLTADEKRMELVKALPIDQLGPEPVALVHGRDAVGGEWLFGLNAKGGQWAGTPDVQTTLWKIRAEGTGFQQLHGIQRQDLGSTGPTTDAFSLTYAGNHLYFTMRMGGTGNGGSLNRIGLDGSDAAVVKSFTSDNRVPGGGISVGGDGLLYMLGEAWNAATNVYDYSVERYDIMGGSFGPAYNFSAADIWSVDTPAGLTSAPDGRLYGIAVKRDGATFTSRLFKTDIGYTPPAPVISLWSETTDLEWTGGPGQAGATLQWRVDNLAPGGTCIAGGDWSGAIDASGTRAVTPTRLGANNYTLTCSNGAATDASASRTFVLRANGPALPVSITTFTASASSLPMEQTLTLAWQTTDAISCQGSSAGTGGASFNGTRVVDADGRGSVAVRLPRSTDPYGVEFTLTCTGAAGETVSRKVSVNATVPEVDGIVSHTSSGGGAASWPLVALLMLASAGGAVWRRRAGIGRGQRQRS